MRNNVDFSAFILMLSLYFLMMPAGVDAHQTALTRDDVMASIHFASISSEPANLPSSECQALQIEIACPAPACTLDGGVGVASCFISLDHHPASNRGRCRAAESRIERILTAIMLSHCTFRYWQLVAAVH